ncbi:MAG: 4-hydroxybenzoate octaprenyltransferase [Bacteroidetes bacterium]|nr:MAG: 4-hydroxybenzoate octaprenyltransferase [Bacteroidota bacterium]
MNTVKNYLSLVKFSHTIFAMPFAMIGFFLGVNAIEASSPWYLRYGYKFIFVVLCMVFARSAAMAFNRYLDRNFDARNPRTAIREIPRGIISANQALVFTIICSSLFVICSWALNNLCFFLSPVALFVILFYSYTKRFTPLCHLVLGLGLSLAPIGAYIAVVGRFNLLPVLFSLTVLFWVSGFDIIYALQDEEFDQSQKLYSIPAALGKVNALRVSEILHLLCASVVVVAGFYGAFHVWYWIGMMVFVGMLIYQHSIVKPHDLKRVNLAFMTANGIASVVFACFVLLDLFLGKIPFSN